MKALLKFSYILLKCYICKKLHGQRSWNMKGKKEKDKNKQYFEKLFLEYSDLIYRLCLYKTTEENVAYDLTQETFLRLWKSISLGKEIRKPKQYIYQIARNLITDHYKSKKEISLDGLVKEGFDLKKQNDSIEVMSEASILKEVIESLDREFRDVLYMRLVEGMKVKEIADILDISENLASVRISRAKEKLREKFTL